MLFLCVLSIFPTKGTRHCGFPLPFQLWLLSPNSGHGDSSAEKNLHWSVLKPLLRSPDPHPGQTLTPDISSNQTDPHPGQMPTLNRRSPQTDPQSRQTLTLDRRSPQTDPHPRQTLKADRPSPQTDPHPGQALTPDRRPPWIDPYPRQTLTPDRPSKQTDPHPGQTLTPDRCSPQTLTPAAAKAGTTVTELPLLTAHSGGQARKACGLSHLPLSHPSVKLGSAPQSTAHK